MFEDVIDTWEGMLDSGEHGQRLIDHHPLKLYFGADVGCRPLFFLITDKKPQVPTMSPLVTVDRGQRKDGTWTVVLTLQDKRLAPAFIGMCLEMVRRSASVANEALALDQFFSTLNQLRSLLSHKPPQRLTVEQLRGLVAEIWFGVVVLLETNSAAEILAAWQGPYGAPQDFRMASGQMFEVKALRAGARAFDVSSVDQLDPGTDGSLTVSAVLLDDATSTTPNSFTVLSLIEALKSELIEDPQALDGLEHRLAALGFEADDDFYAHYYFTVSGARFFPVTAEFPRLLHANVPIALERVTYRVRIAGISHLEVSRDEVGLQKVKKT